MRGRADTLLLFFSPHLGAGELARSRANSQTSNLPPIPHILTRHRSTAELRVVGIEASRTESLTDEPSPESNNLAMSRLRDRETITSPCAGLAPSLRVCLNFIRPSWNGWNGTRLFVAVRSIPPCFQVFVSIPNTCLLYTSPSPRDGLLSRMPSSA